MFNVLKELYLEKRIDEAALIRAVNFKWVTEDEKKVIMDSKVMQGQ